MPKFTRFANVWYAALAAVSVVHLPMSSASTDATAESPPRVMVVVGPSGVGKTKIINGAFEYLPDGFAFPVSTTTRGRRPGETDAVDYNFVSEATFARMEQEGKLLLSSPHNGANYGLSSDEFEKAAATGKIVLLQHMSAATAKSLKESGKIPHAKFVIVVPPGHDLETQIGVLRQRLAGRGTETEAAVQVRLHDSVAELQYAFETGLFDLVLVKDDLHVAILSFLAFIHDNFQQERTTASINRALKALRWCSTGVVLVSFLSVVGLASSRKLVRSWCLGKTDASMTSPLLAV